MSEPDPPVFEIGLVLAGAISAGAYTAGVMDFLIEALDAWERAKAAPGYRGPRHDVRLKVITGASAGGMTAAISAVALHAETDPVHDVDAAPAPDRNRLYDAWVRRIDIAALLGDEDIRQARKLVSALDTSELDRIATEALQVSQRDTPRGWVADPLAIFLTVANLRGVPYGFSLLGGDATAAYGMTSHKDHMRFALSNGGNTIPGARPLDPAQVPDVHWSQLVQTALASGAFPIGLRARALERPREDYRARMSRPPLWPEPPSGATTDYYRFLCVDGGLIDNEPLELARRYLARGGRNPRDGELAHRAVVMVDPFPNAAALGEDNSAQDGLFAVAQGMFGALVNQARFKQEELELAESKTNYSRFMIAPSRFDASGQRSELAMASATLGGFGGFLSEDYRKHDFQLGRRNCQRFLQRYFRLPATNRLFDTWQDPDARDAWFVRKGDGTLDTFVGNPAAGNPAAGNPAAGNPAVPMLPIIPLVEAVRGEIPQHSAPRAASVDLAQLERSVKKRTRAAGSALIDGDLRRFLGSPILSWFLRLLFNWRIAPRLAAKARKRVGEDIARLG